MDGSSNTTMEYYCTYYYDATFLRYLHGILPFPELKAQHHDGPHQVQRGQPVVHYVFENCQSQLWDIIFGVVQVSRNSS